MLFLANKDAITCQDSVMKLSCEEYPDTRISIVSARYGRISDAVCVPEGTTDADIAGWDLDCQRPAGDERDALEVAGM